ncbi:MAG: hypothetical protein H0T47_11555 [Planctomycetaceae bacterium]|nr:hypothetical protein [Planctomycetaceae bacterium]
MKVTGYDRASAFVLAAVLATGVSVLMLVAIWSAQHNWRTDDAVPLELVVTSGGEEDGSETETLDLKTPFEETPDPSLAEVRDDKTEIEPMLESVVDLADRATDMARQQSDTDAVNAGNPGSKSGTGGAALGIGPGDGGLPREQRWFVRFSEGGTTYQYAKELDSFGIELGALLPGGKLAYVSNLSADRPTVRHSESGAGEDRLYFTWQGGGRRTADIELFRKVGIDVGTAPVFHFYPKPTEERLARLESEYANRQTRDIRRTYFAVEPRGAKFEFVVTRQAYFR